MQTLNYFKIKCLLLFMCNKVIGGTFSNIPIGILLKIYQFMISLVAFLRESFYTQLTLF